MKLKGLTESKGERDVKAVLEDRLAKRPYQVWGKVRLGAMIVKDPGEYLTDELFAYLKSAEFDYVILHRAPPNLPLLAIEFDGPHHEFEPRARRNDVLKNQLCRMAGLPILRVRSGEIEPLFRRDSFLSYIVDVILRHVAVRERTHYRQPANDEIKRHVLADVRRLQHELARKHLLFSASRGTEVAGAQLAYEFNLGAVDYASSETDAIYEGHLILRQIEPTSPSDAWPVLRRISKALSLRTHYRVTQDPRPPLPTGIGDLTAFEAYVSWLEKTPWYSPRSSRHQLAVRCLEYP